MCLWMDFFRRTAGNIGDKLVIPCIRDLEFLEQGTYVPEKSLSPLDLLTSRPFRCARPFKPFSGLHSNIEIERQAIADLDSVLVLQVTRVMIDPLPKGHASPGRKLIRWHTAVFPVLSLA